MKNNPLWLVLVGVLVMLLIVGWAAQQVVGLVGNTIEAGVAPVRGMADAVGTQVSNLLNPTPTIIPDPVTIVHEVRSLARLETIRYSVEKIIVAESGQGIFDFLFGDRILFVAHGSVIAGVDLEKLEADDLWTENGVLYVRLPEAEVFIASLNNEQSYIYDREIGALTRGNQQLETEARQAAEAEILNAALEDDILAQALVNAENFLYRLLLDLGFPDVIFVGAGE
jgi:hypothetical protein